MRTPQLRAGSQLAVHESSPKRRDDLDEYFLTEGQYIHSRRRRLFTLAVLAVIVDERVES